MDVRCTIGYIFAISKTCYKGILVWQTGDDYRLILDGQEHVFDSLEQATNYIDTHEMANETHN